MAIPPDEEPAAADLFIDGLARDASLRQRYIDAGHDENAVANLIADYTGKDVDATNLPGITAYLSADRADDCDALAGEYPALNMIIQGGG